MSTHEDDSATVVADGIEYRCHAKLQSATDRQAVDSFAGRESVDGKVSWGGTLTILGDTVMNDAYAVHEAEVRELRTNGRTATFIPASGGNLGEGVLKITGNYAPPFD
ncbi:hypothetical protein ACFWA1_35910 [Streptomyces sp. NPDC060005]|uniref:hypothetical protein n=1 Tax=Streptomyces sp. NPDC060005 TaxID=3347034 RepID=UPI003687A921